jgi:hypothetical protein
MEGSYTFIPYGATSYKVKGAETTAASQGINTSEDFDAYVVDSRDAKVPSTVKSYDGANTYNNFDTDKSVMYSYKADDAATAKANVMAYAGRVQGGNFKWSFDNSKDDAASEVNQALKDALVAYKGWNGSSIQAVIPGSSSSSSSVIPGNDPESSSSSADPESSSSSTIPESSSSSAETESSSSTTVIPGSAPEPGAIPAIRYVAGAARLEIGVQGPFRVDILRLDGTKVFSSRSREIDLSRLSPGVYLARLAQKGHVNVKTFLR